LWSAGRDRLCLRDDRAGLIVYAAEGNSNCTVRGAIANEGRSFRIQPDGEGSCTIDVQRDGSALILGEQTPSCAYYCGPRASFAGKRLEPLNGAEAAVDLAGDPLC
jgi:hypothetical protein